MLRARTRSAAERPRSAAVTSLAWVDLGDLDCDHLAVSTWYPVPVGAEQERVISPCAVRVVVATNIGREDGPKGTIALAAVTPVFDGFSVAVSSVESRPDGFHIEVDVAPGTEGGGPFDWGVRPRQLAWWAADDRGNHYLGHSGSWSGDEDHSSGDIDFWPPLHPAAGELRIMPTGEKSRAVINVPLPWHKQQANGETST
jgi:hypothetical protein